MKATIKDIVPGRVLYHVSFVVGRYGSPPVLDHKTVVLSHPKTNPNIGFLMFDSDDDYRPYGLDWHRKNTYHFLGDNGLEDRVHNMHRFFTCESTALAYVAECRAEVFSDPADQECFARMKDMGDSDLFDYDD